MKMPNSQKGFAIVQLFLVAVGIFVLIIAGLYGYSVISDKLHPHKIEDTAPRFNNITPSYTDIPASSSSAINPFDAEKKFLKLYEAKYPKPSPQATPKGLEDELFKIYIQNSDVKKYISKDIDRSQFIFREYYGDVAIGEISNCKLGEKDCGGGAQWTMNKVNEKWEVIFYGRQEAPGCETIQAILNKLKDWQGECFTNDPKKGSRLIDGKHPNEPYNNY